MESTRSEYFDEFIEAPLAVAVFEILSGNARRARIEPDGAAPWQQSNSPEPPVSALQSISGNTLRNSILEAYNLIAGPYVTNAPNRVAAAKRNALRRPRSIQELIDRGATELNAELKPNGQEWWTPRYDTDDLTRRQTSSTRSLPWHPPERSIWTCTSPEPTLYASLVEAWDYIDEPISRWLVNPPPSPLRILELSRPSDWIGLVERFPILYHEAKTGWEFDDFDSGSARPRVVALPDWTKVGQHYDGVHLTWWGVLMLEGRVMTVTVDGQDCITMLRMWGSERTLWLGRMPALAVQLATVPHDGHRENHATRRQHDEAVYALATAR